MIWDDAIQLELAERRAAGLERRMRVLASAAAPTGRVDGREALVFGSNNYLGLADDERVRQAAANAAQQYGGGSGGSRLTTGNSFLNVELEAELAEFKQTERALLFSSGYAANVGALPALTNDQDLIISDELNHASLIDGCRLSRAEVRLMQHGDPDFAYFILRKERSNFRRVLIVTDGVFSMDGDIAPLPGLVEVAEQFGAAIFVDDAHALGVLGDGGRGTMQRFGLSGHPAFIQMGTLSKALGSAGGYIAGSSPLVELLRQKARSFMFSTGLPPAAIAAAWQALRLLRAEPERVESLRANSRWMRAALKERGFRLLASSDETPIIPLLIGDEREAVRFAQGCFERGLFAPAIRPPTVPKGTSRIRLSVMATHSPQDLARAVDIIAATALELRSM